MLAFSLVLYEVSFLDYTSAWYVILIHLFSFVLYLCCFYRFSAMYLYSGDNRLRSDSSVLLCLLLYSDFILFVPEPVKSSSPWYRFSVPDLVARRMRLPFLCHTHWHNSPHTQHSEKSMKLLKCKGQGLT
jgi:hypothetical protein